MKNKEDLVDYVKKNWKKIPYMCNMPEDGVKELVEKGCTYNTGRDLEHFNIVEKHNEKNGEKYARIESSVLGMDEYGEEGYFLSSSMGFTEDNTFDGVIYGDTDIGFSITHEGEVEFKKSHNGRMKDRDEVLQHLMKDKTVVTHFGDDLDNKSSIYAIESFLKTLGVLDKNEHLKVDRVPAGQIKEGYLNIDTGGHNGNKFDKDTQTIVIDGNPKNDVKSACQSLSDIGIYVPEQIYELADAKPTHISALDSRTGLSLVRYLSGEQAFKLAEDGLLDKSLTDEQLEKYSLTDAHNKQQQIIDSAVEKINKYTEELPNGEKIVLSPEQIKAGSSVAYEMGIPYYASTTQHFNKEGIEDGVTFAISCKLGMKLPQEILEYGEKLVEEYRIDEKTSGVFVNPNGQLIVAGGPKNPDFKIEGYTPETMLEELKNVACNQRNQHNSDEIGEDLKSIARSSHKIDVLDVVTATKENEHDINKQNSK